MEGQIDLTKDSDDERDERDERQSTFESDAALARKLSAELNGEEPKAQNNKRTIDLTADSQEDAAPPLTRGRGHCAYLARGCSKGL